MTGRGRVAALVLILGGLILVGVVGSLGKGSGGPLDPNGTGPVGAKALVLLLRQYGAQVDSLDGVPGPDTPVAVVLNDQLDDTRRAAIDKWVIAGGRLVVADPLSPLEVGDLAEVDSGANPEGECAIPGVAGVRRLDVGASLYRIGDGTGCFGGGAGTWFVLARPQGRGVVIGLGGAGVWANQRLDHDDNAALALGLLGTGRVGVLVASPVGHGNRTTYGLISPRDHLALVQLVVAFAVLAWWRGRRLGRPVPEAEPVHLPASDLVAAVGNLLARTRGRAAAADQLRRSTRRWAAVRLGLPPTASADDLRNAGVVDEGTLADGTVPDDQALVRLGQSLSQLREEVAHGRVR